MSRSFIALSTFALVAALAAPALAQEFPSGLIRIVVPSPSGTPPDTVNRIVASHIAESQGWQVIVENKPGAIQTIGLGEVLKRPADGYTLAAIALSSTAAPALLPKVAFRLDRDFSAVIKLASAHHVLVVIPPRDHAELKRTILTHSRRIQKSPDRVRKYFEHELIRYAA